MASIHGWFVQQPDSVAFPGGTLLDIEAGQFAQEVGRHHDFQKAFCAQMEIIPQKGIALVAALEEGVGQFAGGFIDRKVPEHAEVLSIGTDHIITQIGFQIVRAQTRWRTKGHDITSKFKGKSKGLRFLLFGI
jgi:hypothetical protein